MKQTQNQFYGKKSEMPHRLPPGSTYLCSDEDTMYHAREDGSPILFEVPSDNIDALVVGKKLIGWQDFADSNTSELNPLVQSNISGGEVQITNNNNDTATDGNTNVNYETTVEGLNDTWDTNTNTIIFKDTGFEKNDLFFIRFHVNVRANIVPQDFDIRVDFYDQPAGQGNYVFSLRKSGQSINESAGIFVEDFIYVEGYVGESILEGSAKAYLEGSSAFEFEVIGHKINIQKIAR